MPTNKTLIGCLFAIASTIIWSGNFIVARGLISEMPPIAISFFRWLLATIVIAPFAFSSFKTNWKAIRQNGGYLFWAALFGIALFNTFVYIAGHYTPAINLALIGTTTSPIMAIILAAIFLKEPITTPRLFGLFLCIAGILFLLSKGSLQTLWHFQFSTGDWWILLAALSFAVYNTLAKKKPANIAPLSFLFIIFLIGTILLTPFFLWEKSVTPPIVWNAHLLWVMAYLGIGTSVLAFLFWNKAIAALGASRTALFGNLIPIFSCIEAVWLLHEKVTWVHAVSGAMVVAGIVFANISFKKKLKG